MSTATSKVDEILSVLRTEILSGQYRPGERMPSERDLATRFGSNRGAIREVIKKLEQLGIIEVNPGGVRVVPVEQATLDVVRYLLELGAIDQQQLIGQLLDVLGSMMALSVRSALSLATKEECKDIAEAIEGLICSIDQNNEELHHESFKLLNDELIAIHQNLVLRLIGNGIRTQFIAHIRRENFSPNIDVTRIREALIDFKTAVLSGDPDTAGTAITSHFMLLKDATQIMPDAETSPPRKTDYA